MVWEENVRGRASPGTPSPLPSSRETKTHRGVQKRPDNPERLPRRSECGWVEVGVPGRADDVLCLEPRERAEHEGQADCGRAESADGVERECMSY